MNKEMIAERVGERVGILGLIAILGLDALGASSVTEAMCVVRDMMDSVMDEAKRIHEDDTNRVKAIVYFRATMSGLIGCPDLHTCSRMYNGETLTDSDIVFHLN